MINHLKNTLILSLLLVVFTPIKQYAQGFNGAIVFGANGAQIDGDKLVGFNKLGLEAGVRVSYPIKEKTDIGIEMLFSQRGSKSKKGAGVAQFLNLDYFSIPIFINYKDWYLPDEGYYKVKVEGGFSYARLIDLDSNIFEDDDIDMFKDNDFSIHLGVSYHINKNWAFTARYNRSLVYLWESTKLTNVEGLISYYWNFRFEYHF